MTESEAEYWWMIDLVWCPGPDEEPMWVPGFSEITFADIQETSFSKDASGCCFTVNASVDVTRLSHFSPGIPVFLIAPGVRKDIGRLMSIETRAEIYKPVEYILHIEKRTQNES